MKAYILGYDRDVKYLLEQFGYDSIQSDTYLKDNGIFSEGIDLVVFLGGADIYPGLYGQPNLGSMYNSDSIKRDYAEEMVYHQAMASNIPCFGICRGFQFINVMNRGTMRQDVPGHTGNYGHHPVMDNTGTELFYVNSYHHQQVVLDTLEVTDVLYAPPRSSLSEVESAIWPDACSGGVQWHPEWMEWDEKGRLYVEKLLCKLQNLRELKINKL